jgi:peptide/nickel transport system ATP-binding protein/oligopeptide transport system ATP-binding protein
LRRHLGLGRSAALKRAADLLDRVGIRNPVQQLGAYPHQLSGGMRQRAMIAMAICCEPKLLIADEPTTALDVTVQAQILELVTALQEASGMSVIWVTHDMAVVSGFADWLQVMYAGRIVESGPVDAVFSQPRNAYTWGLIQSVPDPTRPRRRLHQIRGQAVNLLAPPKGDAFAPRNPFATELCRTSLPPLRQVEGGIEGHKVAAWYDLPKLLAEHQAQ